MAPAAARQLDAELTVVDSIRDEEEVGESSGGGDDHKRAGAYAPSPDRG